MRGVIRVLAGILLLVFLPSCCFAEGLPESFADIIPAKRTDGLLLKVEENGRTQAVHVLWENEHCYVPAETLEQMTCYIHEETGAVTGRFIRRKQALSGRNPFSYVEYDGESRQLKVHTWFRICYYGMDGVLVRDGTRYLPLDQLLPFLHAQWERKEDRLVITNDPWSLDDVLPYTDDLIFQMDDIVDGGFLASRLAVVSNFMIDALLNFRLEYFVPAFDAVNGLSGSQGVHDNVETVVKGYLADDSAYLADDGSTLTAGNGYLYDSAKTASGNVQTLQQLKSDASELKKYLGKLGMDDLKKELDQLHLDQFLTAAKAQEICESMLTDHYRMLDAMFNYSGTHAGYVPDGYFSEIARYVWESYADTLDAMTSELIRTETTDRLTKELKSGVRGMFLTTTQQVILDVVKRTVKLFTNADEWSRSMVKNYYHDAFAAMARDRISSLLREDLTEANLEDVRLCALMMLTASRQGFDELADFYHAQVADMEDAAEVFRQQAEEIKQYQQILYLCYDCIERDSPDACRDRQPELATALMKMHRAGQLYDFDPYTFDGIEISYMRHEESDGIAVTDYSLRGESRYQRYSINLPVFDTGDAELDAWLWNEISGKLYANHTTEERLKSWDDDYEYFRDNIVTSYSVSTGFPGAIFIKTYYTNTPACEADRYYEVEGSHVIDLNIRAEIPLYQLFTVSEAEFRTRMIQAIADSENFRNYLQRAKDNGWDELSSPGSLALDAITEEGWIYSEDDPSGVAYYASRILVPWSEIPFDASEYANGHYPGGN